MRRRQFIRGLSTAPVLAALPLAAQQEPVDKTKALPGQKVPAEVKPAPGNVGEIPKLPMTVADAAAECPRSYFTEVQMATLRKLCEALVPTSGGRPGAADARVPEFLDFLIGTSPEARQQLYRAGLDELHARASRDGGFDAALASLKQPWTFTGPPDSLARFLETAKEDIFRATVNSREWAAASHGRRTSTSTYWFPVE